MRGALAAAVALAACATATPPAAEPEPVDDEALAVRKPEARPDGSLGAPAVGERPRVGLAALPGTTWQVEALGELVFDEVAASARLNGAPLAFTGDPSGGTLSGEVDLTLVVLTGCDAMIHDPTHAAWREARLTRPGCGPEDHAYKGTLLSTWTTASGTRYTWVTPDRLWRRGDGRSFDHPVGERVQDGTGGLNVRFGGSTFRVLSLDACHQVLWLDSPRRVHGAVRTFPTCPPSQRTYDGFGWSTWSLPGGDLLHLRGSLQAPGTATAGTAIVERATSTTPLTGAWTVEGERVRIEIDGAPPARLARTGRCAGTFVDAGRTVPATRLYPSCGPGAAP